MATITLTDASQSARRALDWPHRDRLLGTVIILAAVGTLWASCTGFIDTTSRIPANRYFETHEDQWKSPEEQDSILERAIEHYQQIPPSARGAQEDRRLAGLLLMAAKESAPKPGDGRRLTGDEELPSTAKVSLKAEPAHPLAWAYLADAELLSRADKEKALEYLEQSYRVGPLDPDFFFYRLGLAFKCQSQWDVEIIRRLSADIASLFSEEGRNKNRKRFIQLSKSTPKLRAITETLLKGNPAVLQRYLTALQ